MLDTVSIVIRDISIALVYATSRLVHGNSSGAEEQYCREEEVVIKMILTKLN